MAPMAAGRGDDLTEIIAISPKALILSWMQMFLSQSTVAFDFYAAQILYLVIGPSADAYKRTNWPIIPPTMRHCRDLLEGY